jgi:DNA-binding MurR/RpiR family transcriptional regulator
VLEIHGAQQLFAIGSQDISAAKSACNCRQDRCEGKPGVGANQPAVSKTATKSRPVQSRPSRNGRITRPNGKTLSTYITERFEDFSRSQKDVARYIVDHLDEAAFQTAEELARRANTSSSTVVRFSQALGFEGYPELQQAAIEEYRHRAPEENGGPNAPLFDFDHSEFEASLAADHANVEETVRNLTREQVEACVTALASSQRVMIVGMDQLAFFASYLRHLLALLDIRAEVISSPRQDSITRLSRVDEDSLVVAFSAGRAHPIVVRAMKLAKHRRAKTLSISDATLSEVGEHSDLTIYYSSNSPSFTRSNTSLLSIVQALAYGVYSRDAAAYKDRIRAFKLK